tara:strand:+ start:191 stop:367 length:177 start_codon:yes stop_codon:yes gene_type:complete
VKVRDIVHLKTDRPGQEVLGKVMAVNIRAKRVTVQWEGMKLTEHKSEDLMLFDAAYQN